jgi:Flp pilus assembly protein TadB
MTALTVAAVVAVGAAGLLLLGRGLFGPPPSLDEALADLHRTRNRSAERATDRSARAARATRSPAVRVLAGAPSNRVLADLMVCERDLARWALDRVKWAVLGGGFLAAVVIVVPVAGGGRPPLTLAAIVLPAGAAGGWGYAVVDLRRDAERARREVRHAVAAYLELVTILMAGGAGPESAMHLAAGIGRGPAFRHLRSALAAAQVRQEPPWSFLGALGRRLAVEELVELGAAMSLAGGGAQVKDTLGVKASSIRARDLAQVEARAQARSETMALPVVLMFTGFLLLIGYPALAALSGP